MGLISAYIALQLMTVLIRAGNNDVDDYFNLPDLLNPSTISPPPDVASTSSSAVGLGEFGAYDPSPYPSIDTYPDRKTVRVGDSVDFLCTASDKADHERGLPKHDLSIEIFYEADPTRDLSHVDHEWYESTSINTKARPSFLTKRVDITETGEVSLYKEYATYKDKGWYVCRACVQKDRPTESCDVNKARFYLDVLGAPGAQQDDPTVTPPPPTEGVPESGALLIEQENPRSTCQIFGDPHVVTFDGHIYTLGGSSCHYILALDHGASRWFVYGKTGPCGAIAQGFCLETISIYGQGDALELQRGWLLNHNGQKIETKELTETVKVGVFEVEFLGTNVEARLLIGEEITELGVKVQDWLKVSWDGLTTVTIESPRSAKTQGLCGNNDRNPDNDFNVWGTTNTDQLLFSENVKVDRNKKCESGQDAHTTESIEQLCGDRLVKVQSKCNRIFSIRPFEGCLHDREPYYNSCIYDECKGFSIRSNLYAWMQIENVDRVLSPGCAAAEAYALKCSLKSWTDQGDIIASVDTDGWELLTRACPLPSTKLEYIPKLGCPQSFMPEFLLL